MRSSHVSQHLLRVFGSEVVRYAGAKPLHAAAVLGLNSHELLNSDELGGFGWVKGCDVRSCVHSVTSGWGSMVKHLRKVGERACAEFGAAGLQVTRGRSVTGVGQLAMVAASRRSATVPR